MKKRVKPTSVRLDKDMLEEVDQRCDKVGCSRNDFIKNSVEFAITQTSDFDFGDDEEMDETKEEPEPIPRTEGKIIGVISDSGEVKEVLNAKISYD